MQTALIARQVTTEEAAEAIALKHRLALLTADPVLIPGSCGVIAKHQNIWLRTWLTGRFSSAPADCTKTR
jgi:hypothetical protein